MLYLPNDESQNSSRLQNYYVSEPITNTSSIKSNLDESRYSRPSTSTPEADISQWNLYPENSNEATILRTQHNLKQQEQLVNTQQERKCPPIPPKRTSHLRQTVSQPEIRIAPPIPRRSRTMQRQQKRDARDASANPETIYETIRGSQQSPTRYELELRPSSVATYNRNKPRSEPETVGESLGIRSASSNEIFKLYQTRDCLGNLLYEL